MKYRDGEKGREVKIWRERNEGEERAGKGWREHNVRKGMGGKYMERKRGR